MKNRKLTKSVFEQVRRERGRIFDRFVAGCRLVVRRRHVGIGVESALGDEAHRNQCPLKFVYLAGPGGHHIGEDRVLGGRRHARLGLISLGLDLLGFDGDQLDSNRASLARSPEPGRRLLCELAGGLRVLRSGEASVLAGRHGGAAGGSGGGSCPRRAPDMCLYSRGHTDGAR
jgi:hypothetical protein